MRQRTAYASLLLLTTTLVAPAALAQVAPSTGAPAAPAPAPATASPVTPADTAADPQQDQAEVSAPGVDTSASEDIVVVGRNIPNTVRATAQVVSAAACATSAGKSTSGLRWRRVPR